MSPLRSSLAKKKMVKRKEEEEEERQQQQQKKKFRVKKVFGWFLCVTTPTDSRQSECRRFEKKMMLSLPTYKYYVGYSTVPTVEKNWVFCI
jgi:hypothetical protein